MELGVNSAATSSDLDHHKKLEMKNEDKGDSDTYHVT